MTESENQAALNKSNQTNEQFDTLQSLALDTDESLSFLGCVEERRDLLLLLRQYDQTPGGIVDIAPTNEPQPYTLQKKQANDLMSELGKHLQSEGMGKY